MGAVCYDPKTYTCPVGSAGPILCGDQENGPDGACGTICYDMVLYQCCKGELYELHDTSSPCGPQGSPGAACPIQRVDRSTRATPQCADFERVCDDARMGPTCYDPQSNSCPSGSCGPILCGFQEHGPDGACGTICYDYHTYLCCDNTLYNINDTTAPCYPGQPSTIINAEPTTTPTTQAPTSSPTSAPPANNCPGAAGTAGVNCSEGTTCCGYGTMTPSCLPADGSKKCCTWYLSSTQCDPDAVCGGSLGPGASSYAQCGAPGSSFCNKGFGSNSFCADETYNCCGYQSAYSFCCPQNCGCNNGNYTCAC